tara:strand:+ start:56 stop:1384 length:1329 start_codon:yes stop_codon:yes gene_type:complete
MRKIFLLRPMTYSLFVAPYFLKKILLKKRYFLLPSNRYLRTIIIFFYLNFLRKPKVLINLLIKTKIILSNPKKFEYLIFDKSSLGTVDKILPKNKFFVLDTRIEHFEKIYISKDILFYILTNFFKNSLKVNYICSLVKFMKPKKIITIIDNSVDFYFIYNQFKDAGISFYAIQNAYRHNIYLKKIFSLTNYYGNYYCFGNYEFNCIKNNNTSKKISNVKPIGSLRIEVAKEYLLKNKKKKFKKIYDICFISEADYQVSTSGAPNSLYYVDAHKSQIKLLQYILTFCKKNKKRLLFLGRNSSSFQNRENTKKEEILYYKYRNKNNDFNIQFFDKTKFENIKHLLQSEVVVGITSTLVRESFGLKKKVLACDWLKRKSSYLGQNYFPSDGIIKLKSQKYADFEKRMNEILSLGYNEYLSKVINPKSTYNLNFNTLKFLRKEMLK